MLRRVIAVMCMLAYLLTGALHDVTHAGSLISADQGFTITSSIPTSNDGIDKAIGVSHHCHACFSVSISKPAGLMVPEEISKKMRITVAPALATAISRLDPPPPKFLT